MSDLLRFGVSIEDNLLESFDRLIAERGYVNRSEALRDMIRDTLVQARLENTPKSVQVIGSLTLVYDHHAHDLADQMSSLQHENHDLVVSVTHVHVNHDDCMEVILLRGQAGRVHQLADGLLSLKGVKHGKLFITLPSHNVTGDGGATKNRHKHTAGNHGEHADGHHRHK